MTFPTLSTSVLVEGVDLGLYGGPPLFSGFRHYFPYGVQVTFPCMSLRPFNSALPHIGREFHALMIQQCYNLQVVQCDSFEYCIVFRHHVYYSEVYIYRCLFGMVFKGYWEGDYPYYRYFLLDQGLLPRLGMILDLPPLVLGLGRCPSIRCLWRLLY